MRRLRLIGVPAVLLVAAMVGAVSTSAEASSAVKPPGPPTAVQATFVPGVGGVTVSWGAPISDGGASILYYVATTYNGKHYCISHGPGPDTCHIDGLRESRGGPSIRVKAVNSKGRGSVVAVLPTATTATGSGGSSASGNGGGSPSSISSGAAQPGSGPGSSTVASDTGAAGNAGTTSDVPAELPFTGINLATLVTLGVSLVVAGLLILGWFGRRRGGADVTLSRLLGPG